MDALVPRGLHRKAAGCKHKPSDFYRCPMRAPVFHNRNVTAALSGEEQREADDVFIKCKINFQLIKSVLNIAGLIGTTFEKLFKVELSTTLEQCWF